MSPSVKIAKMPVKRIPVKTEDRQNIGARNPYALADAVLGERQAWHRMSTDEKKTMLEKALRRPFEQLFDPRHKSPLFSRQVIQDVTGEVLSQAGSPCTSVIAGWTSLAGGAYLKDPLSDKTYVSDPIQGCGVDCYLVSAFASVSWVSPHLLPNQAGPKYTYSFWNFSTGKKETVPDMDDRLPLDARGMPIYARSIDPTETWPPLIEKGYGIWRGLPGSARGEPDLAQDPGGNAVTALAQIAKAVTSTYASTTVYTKDCGYKWSTMLGKIYTRFDPANSDCLKITTSKTKVPMVAYTYLSATAAPAGVTYSGDTIVANHAYSVLGLYKYNNKCYIVLRNPYGPLAGDPALAGNLAGGDWVITNNKYYTKAGTSSSAPSPFRVTLADNDGTFALDTDIFMTHFQALGYIS